MKFTKAVVSLLLLTASTQALAICETEKEEYADWSSKCEKLSGSSQITGAIGGAFAFLTFGASMVPCAGLIVAAKNACRIRDEKKNNLDRCISAYAESARRAEERIARIEAIDADYANRRQVLTAEYQAKFEAFLTEYREEGWDMSTPESQEYLRQVRLSFEAEVNAKLDLLEQDRVRAISNA